MHDRMVLHVGGSSIWSAQHRSSLMHDKIDLHLGGSSDCIAVAQAKRHGLPGGEEEKEALEDAAAPTDIPRLFAPGRLLYLSQQGESP